MPPAALVHRLVARARAAPGRTLLAAGCALAVAGGVALRLWLLATTMGSNDVVYWRQFADVIERHGLIECYRRVPHFNHPPLMGWVAWLAHRLAALAGWRFETALKLFPLAADLFVIALLLRVRREQGGRALLAAALFAASPVSILVTGYHGNTDPAVGALALLGAWLLDGRRPFGAGLALGAAINVKLVGVLLLPVFALQARRWRDVAALAGGLALAALPFLPVLVLAGEPFWQRAIAYNSAANRWGLTVFFEFGNLANYVASYTMHLFPVFRSHGRYLVLLAIVVLAVICRRQRRGTTVEVAGLALVLFLILTPGFGVQYTVYLVPFLTAVHLGHAALYSALAGLFLLVTYLALWNGQTPYYSKFGDYYPLISVATGLVAWTALVCGFVALVRRRRPWPAPAGGEEGRAA